MARARHVEVQILGDGIDVIHLYERDCSIQRRRQKVWEEAPASCLDPGCARGPLRIRGAGGRAVNYRGAGTLEFLYDETTGEFFFIEMNTRIQVEHPVTEMITGIDIVNEMLRIAGGEPLRIRQSEIRITGTRLNAVSTPRNRARLHPSRKDHRPPHSRRRGNSFRYDAV